MMMGRLCLPRLARSAPPRRALPSAERVRSARSVWLGRVAPCTPALRAPPPLAAAPRRFVSVGSAEFAANAERSAAVLAQFREVKARLAQGGSPRAVAAHRARGKLMARERVEAVLDVGSPFLELSMLAAWTRGGENKFPSAGLVTGIGLIGGRHCMIVANDPTVQGGTYMPLTIKKHLRAQKVAMENRLPCVYLVESGGGNLTMDASDGSYADETGFGRIFYNQARLSAAGIPQVAVVLGSCTAGGAYIPAMADEVVIVRKNGTIFLAGPPLVKAATGEVVSAEELGGGDMHCSVSGVADHLARDEPHALQLARQVARRCERITCGIIAALPPPPSASLTAGSSIEPRHPASELPGLIPCDAKQPMDMRAILERVIDASELTEFKGEYGRTLITGFARIHGFQVGIVANSGVLDANSSVKGTHFVQLCCQRNVPLIFFQNITGFMVGREAEAAGIAKHGAKLVHAVSCADVPKLTLVVGGSFGAGNYAMCGRAYSPRFMWMWPNARIGVMGGEQAASVLTQVQAAAALKAGKPLDAEKTKELRRGMLAKFDEASAATFATSLLWDDGIIEPEETRQTLGLALEIVANAPETPTKFGVYRM